MKTETFIITEQDLEAFKDACNEIHGVIFISYDIRDKEAVIEYKYNHSLFYLGQMFQLKNAGKWILTT